ncbi:MAG: hypothetical protein ACE5K8_10365, partial [Candidatus Zixiibacteriota bacterium]
MPNRQGRSRQLGGTLKLRVTPSAFLENRFWQKKKQSEWKAQGKSGHNFVTVDGRLLSRARRWCRTDTLEIGHQIGNVNDV